MESPRMFDEVEYTEEELLALELKAVKNERNVLIGDLNTVKLEHAESGADMQKMDLAKMEKHLEYKKHKYNELHQEVLEREKSVQKAQNAAVDSMLRVPEEMEPEQTHINKLKGEMKSLEEELVEAEAKNRLYTLLGERTRREHMSMEKKVREAREMKEDCLEDHAALTSHMHDMRAAKEESEKKLAQMKAQYQQGKEDWDRKLALRKKEVVELRKRQEREKEKEERKAAKLREKEDRERRIQATQEMQMEAYEMQCAALAPKIEAMEASWNRLRSISGAQTTEEVIGYFFSLRSKEENMRELVSQAEKREAKAKQTLAEMLDSRSEMFESALAGQDGTFEEHKSRIDDAERRLALAKKRFNRLRSVCISAEQGVKFLLARLMVALEEPINDAEMHAMLNDFAKGGKGPNALKSPKPDTPPDGEDDVDGDTEGLNRIDDVSFFPKLLDTLRNVAERLNKLLAIEEQYKATPPPEPEPEPAPEPEPEAVPPLAAAEEAEAEAEADGLQEPSQTEAEPAAGEEAAAAATEDGEKPPEGEEEAEAEVATGEGAEDAEGVEVAAAEDSGEPAADSPADTSDPAAAEGEEKPAEEEAEAPTLPVPPPPAAVVEPEPALSETHDSLPEEEVQKAMKEQEAKLAKGMKRTEWCGPAWVETVSGSPIMPGAEVTKRRKGKKKKDQPQPVLTRILGYTGSDVDEDEDEEDDEEDEEDEEWDGFVDRDFIKHRSMKMTLKAQAMAQGQGR